MFRKPLLVHGGHHRCWLIERSCSSSVLFREAIGLVNPLSHERRVARAGQAQGPSERPLPLRKREALLGGMHVCTSPRQPPSRIGNKLAPNRDDAQQVGLRGLLPAAVPGPFPQGRGAEERRVPPVVRSGGLHAAGTA